jgi:hypothetical protein
MYDPQINLQKWGANLASNSVQLEAELLGYTKPLGKDCISKQHIMPAYYPNSYPVNKTNITHQPRASNPAWLIRDQENHRIGREYKALNPIEPVFEHNISTRDSRFSSFTPTG